MKDEKRGDTAAYGQPSIVEILEWLQLIKDWV